MIIGVYFTSTKYFFNRYIAPNITNYGFSYTKANGELLSGFKILNLKYKDKPLSKKVVFKFNPLKLLTKTISVDKLELQNVNQPVLLQILSDFKKESNSSSESSNIALNFELKNINLSVNPFKIEDIQVHRALLNVKYVSFINSKLDIGDSYYNLDTNIGKIVFKGKFKNRVLNIDRAIVTKIDIEKIIKLNNNFNSDANSSNSNNNVALSLIPKLIIAKSAKLSLKPFKVDGFNTKHLEISLKDIKIDTFKQKILNAKTNLLYKSNIANILILSESNSTTFKVKRAKIDILNANKIETLISKIPKSNSNSSFAIPFKNLDLNDFILTVNGYKYKDLNLNKLKITLENLNYNLINSSFNSKKFKLDFKSNLGSIESFGNLDSNISTLQYLNAKDLNINGITKLFESDSNNTKKSEDNSTFVLPMQNLLAKKINIDIKNYKLKPLEFYTGNIEAKDFLIDLKDIKIKKSKLNIKTKSSWGEAFLNGDIKENLFYAKGEYKANQTLFDRYKVPLIAKNIKPLKIVGKFGFKDLDLNASLVGDNVLKGVKDFNFIKSNHRVKYNYISGDVYYKTDAKISTPYTNEAKLENLLTYINKSDKLTYSGKLTPLNKLSFAKNLGDILDDLSLNYKGDTKHIEIELNSKRLKGVLKDKGYNGGILKLTNTTPIKLNNFVTLKGYEGATISKLNIDTPINFNKIMPLNGKIKAISNLLNLDGTYEYKDNFLTKLNLTLPKNSLLKSKQIKLNTLFPAKLELSQSGDNIDIKLKDKLLNIDSKYTINSKNIKANIKTKSLNSIISGNIDNITLNAKINSLKSVISEANSILIKKINQDINGAVNLKANIKNLSQINIDLTSPKIIYKSKKSQTPIENIAINATINKDNITINHYKFKAQKYSIFSNKASKLSLNKDNLKVNSLWINDSLLATGNYNIAKTNGNFKLKANSFKIESPEATAVLNINTNLKLTGDKTAIDGVVNILSGKVTKNFGKKRVTDNEDIIILQKLRAKKSSNFAKNIKLNLKVKSTKSIIYATNDSHFLLRPNLTIIKNFNALTRIDGKIDLLKPSYYLMGHKKLRLKEGRISFKGKSTTPYLNITMHYKGVDVDVGINISGSASRPVIFFSSNPPLTKNQILAYLLFDDISATGTHSQEDMLNTIGGTMAKSFLGSIGIKVDHLSIKQNGFSIGKNIGKHIIIYYNQDEENPSVKTRINITNTVHTDIEISDKKQSADIIFSKEY